MKKVILLIIVVAPVLVSMHNKENILRAAYIQTTVPVLGRPISEDDHDRKQRVFDINKVGENEIVAFVFNGRLVYGVITCKPINSDTILISNSEEDTIRFGRAYNILTTPTYKLSGAKLAIEKGTEK